MESYEELKKGYHQKYPEDKMHPCHNGMGDSKTGECIHCNIHCGGKGFSECTNAFCGRYNECICEKTDCICMGRPRRK